MSEATPKTTKAQNAVTVATTKRGIPITEELAERLADEAEKGYDLDKARIPGREGGA